MKLTREKKTKKLEFSSPMPIYPLVCVCMVLLPYQDPSIKEIITRKPKLGKLENKKKKKNVRGNRGGELNCHKNNS